MNIMLTMKNLKTSEKLNDLVERKSKKLEKYIHQNFKISWNLFTENNLHYAEVKVSGIPGPELRASAQSRNPFAIVDLAVSRLSAQLRKAK